MHALQEFQQRFQTQQFFFRPSREWFYDGGEFYACETYTVVYWPQDEFLTVANGEVYSSYA